MKPLPLLLLALLASACGGSITQPSTPVVTYGVQVVTPSGQPVAGESVQLLMPADATRQDIGQRTLPTNANGVVSWRVEPGHVYPLRIRGERHFDAVEVVNDSRWLVILPE